MPGFLTKGLKKFQDELPLPCDPGTAAAAARRVEITTATGAGREVPPAGGARGQGLRRQAADEYVIGLVQYRTRFSSDLPATLVRGYVQLSTQASRHSRCRSSTSCWTAPACRSPATPVSRPAVAGPGHRGPEGPTGADRLPQPPAQRSGRRPVPAHRQHGHGLGHGPDGDAAPRRPQRDGRRTQSAVHASDPKSNMCFKDNRATLHLHGGITPWISDGTPHQWITPAGETPRGRRA